MNRSLRHLLIAAALVFGQQAAQLHALSHLKQDVAECAGKCAPPLGHPVAQCLAFHAVDSALPNFAPAIDPSWVALPAIALAALPLPFAPRIEFDSRAPPVLS
jgi:hypothetical protein